MGYKHPFLEREHSEVTWCFHCERVSKTEDWIRNHWNCPVEGCDGNALDAHNWTEEDWPCNANPEYPETPVIGEYYPMYASKKES